jgi:hypothetical protein
MATGAAEALVQEGVLEQVDLLLGMLDPVPIELQESASAVLKALNVDGTRDRGMGSSGGSGSGGGSGSDAIERPGTSKKDKGLSGRRSVSLSEIPPGRSGGGGGVGGRGRPPRTASAKSETLPKNYGMGGQGSSSSSTTTTTGKSIRKTNSSSSIKAPPACAASPNKLEVLKARLNRIEADQQWLGEDTN